MKKRTLLMCILIFILILFSLLFLYNKLKVRYENSLFEINKIEGNLSFEPSNVLFAVILGKGNNSMLVSENFKSKYKTSQDIIGNKLKYKVYSSGYDYIDDKRVIIIRAYETKDFFDFINDRYKTTIFYFDYEVKDGLLDDVKLVKTKRIWSQTGDPVIE